MERTYDIFEKQPDGTMLWRAAVAGHEAAIRTLQELAAESLTEFHLMHLPSNSVIATINSPRN